MGGKSVKSLQFDVGNFAKIAENVKKAIDEFGRIDIVIYSAGVHIPSLDCP